MTVAAPTPCSTNGRQQRAHRRSLVTNHHHRLARRSGEPRYRLKAHPAGLTRRQISDALKHNQPAGQIDHALHALHAAGRVTVTQIATGGRPAQLWTASASPPAPAA